MAAWTGASSRERGSPRSGGSRRTPPIIKNKYQTLAYYGFDREELESFVLNNHLIGFDRIVPFGTTASFAFTWDGYDLIETLSRKIEILF